MSEEAMMPGEFDGPGRQSFLMWFFRALGIRYTILIPAAALFAFLVVLFLVLRGKGSALPGALLFVVPLPLLMGCMGVVDGLMASFQVIAASNTAPKPSEIGQAVSMSLVSAWFGAILTIPSYFAASIGLILRALVREPVDSSRTHPPKSF